MAKKALNKKLVAVDLNVFLFSVIFVLDTHCWFDGSLEKLIQKNYRFPRDKYLDYLSAIQLEMAAEVKTKSAYAMSHQTGLSIITLFSYDGDAFDMGTLVHEIGHAVFRQLTDRGIDHNQETDEVYAYCTGYLMRMLCNVLFKP